MAEAPETGLPTPERELTEVDYRAMLDTEDLDFRLSDLHVPSGSRPSLPLPKPLGEFGNVVDALTGLVKLAGMFHANDPVLPDEVRRRGDVAEIADDIARRYDLTYLFIKSRIHGERFAQALPIDGIVTALAATGVLAAVAADFNPLADALALALLRGAEGRILATMDDMTAKRGEAARSGPNRERTFEEEVDQVAEQAGLTDESKAELRQLALQEIERRIRAFGGISQERLSDAVEVGKDLNRAEGRLRSATKAESRRILSTRRFRSWVGRSAADFLEEIGRLEYKALSYYPGFGVYFSRQEIADKLNAMQPQEQAAQPDSEQGHRPWWPFRRRR